MPGRNVRCRPDGRVIPADHPSNVRRSFPASSCQRRCYELLKCLHSRMSLTSVNRASTLSKNSKHFLNRNSARFCARSGHVCCYAEKKDPETAVRNHPRRSYPSAAVVALYFCISFSEAFISSSLIRLSSLTSDRSPQDSFLRPYTLKFPAKQSTAFPPLRSARTALLTGGLDIKVATAPFRTSHIVNKRPPGRRPGEWLFGPDFPCATPLQRQPSLLRPVPAG